MWPRLCHELAKGTAELICLHGLNTLDRDTYEKVTEAADKEEYEVWHLQAAPELWRRVLAVLPNNKKLPEILMNIARLDPRSLETLMIDVVQNPNRARACLESL